MAAARALNDGNLVVSRPIVSMNDVVLGHVAEHARIRELNALEHFRHEVLWIIYEFLHVRFPNS